ncbi:MAG: MgtC/SapB family protein [Eubacterium sp.]|nr:MgtC/SapB family protein [Eubacterium sp.]
MTDLLTVTSIQSVSGFAIHLIVAIILGALIGLERQWTRHAAGILTNLIVCLGAFAFTAFSFLVPVSGIKDITRVAAQVVSGIGFLGAGVILREGGNVRGLNTAATVWASAAVGILCCLDNLFFAIIVGIAIVFLHLVLHPISEKIDKIKKYDKGEKDMEETLYHISVVCPDELELEIRKNIMTTIKNAPDALLHTLETLNYSDDEKKIRAYISTRVRDDTVIENLVTHIGKNEGILSASWKIDHE